jgi:hypothetical protein
LTDSFFHHPTSGVGYRVVWTICGVDWCGAGGGLKGHLLDILDANGPGSHTHISQDPVSVGLHTFRAEVISDSTVRASIDGVIIATYTYAALSPVNPAGIQLYVQSGIGSRQEKVRITSFAAGVPPCPPTGDSLLDSKAMRDLLTMAWDSSNAFDSNKLNRRERGGFLYTDASGNLTFANSFSVNDKPCSAPNLLPPGVPPSSVKAEVHTHPFSGDTLGSGMGEETTGICSQAVAGTRKYYDAATYGGPSKEDLSRGTNDNLPMYIMDKDNIYSFPPGTTPSNWKSRVKKYPRKDPSGCTRP